MILTREQLVNVLAAANVFRGSWALLDSTYETLDPVWLATRAWPAWVQSLPPHLREARDLGGGKSMWVPKWLPEVWDCDNHAWSFWEFVMRCRAEDAASKGLTALAGTAAGNFAYTAEPKAGNRRLGRHDIFWFVDDAGDFRVFESADGAFDVLTPTEVLSVDAGEAR